MTNITKAAQDALEAMERYQVKRQDFERFADEITALRAALQDKAGEVREPVAWALEYGSVSLPQGHASRVTEWQVHPTKEDAEKAAEAMDFDSRILPIGAQPAPVVPDGFALVPVEPTPEMCAAAVVFANGNAVYKNVAADVLKIEESIYGEVYSAMIAASQQKGGQ